MVVILSDYKGLHADLINTLLLVTKQYISATKYEKCRQPQLNFLNLAQKFYDLKNLERMIVTRENRTFAYEL